MSLSQLQICNLALNHLGMNSVSALTDDNPSVDACNVFYEPVRDDVFRELKWPFATIQAVLTTTSATIVGWDYVYTYPANAVTVWSVYNEATVDRKDEQEFEVLLSDETSTGAKIICTNTADAYADYTFKTSDTSVYDTKFVFALSYKLAATMAHMLIGSAEKGLKLMEIYNAIIHEAKRISAIEKLKKPVFNSSYQDSRG